MFDYARNCFIAAVIACASLEAGAELTLSTQFNPAEVGGIVSLAYDTQQEEVWVYGSFAGEIRRYTTAGVDLGSVPRPGDSANDADLDFVTQGLALNGTPVPVGSLLFIDGEIGNAEVYAIDPDTGGVIATLNTAFGQDHVVGGAYHPVRNTLFLVQDKQTSSSVTDSVVAEIDPADGSVLNSFKVDDLLPGFTVNWGDIDIDPVFHDLFIVSSDESTVARFSDTGTFIETLALPGGVSALAGIGFADDASGTAWVASNSGVVSLLEGFPTLLGDLNGDGFVGLDDLDIVLNNWNQNVPPADPRADPSGDGYVGLDDLDTVLNNWNAGTAPGAGVSIPEPTSAMLLGLVGITALFRRGV